MRGVHWLRVLCFWLGWVSLVLAVIIAARRINEIYHPLSPGLGYRPNLYLVLIELYPLLLSFIPFAVWGILTVFCDIHRLLEQQAR